MALKHGSLFSGIEGFGEGAKRAGIKTLFEVEQKVFCRNVCKEKYNAKQYSDIKEFDGREWRGKVDVLSGGFPCQDISVAGKQEGIKGAKSYLWAEYARIIGETNCKYAIIENSPQLLRVGFERVLCDLSDLGYDAQWECISCSAFGMPHRRKRLFVIAYANGTRRQELLHGDSGRIFKKIKKEKDAALDNKRSPFLQFEQRFGKPAVFGVDDGVRDRSRSRSYLVPRLSAYGNAVSPVIAEYLFECIKYDHMQRFDNN